MYFRESALSFLIGQFDVVSELLHHLDKGPIDNLVRRLYKSADIRCRSSYLICDLCLRGLFFQALHFYIYLYIILKHTANLISSIEFHIQLNLLYLSRQALHSYLVISIKIAAGSSPTALVLYCLMHLLLSPSPI